MTPCGDNSLVCDQTAQAHENSIKREDLSPASLPRTLTDYFTKQQEASQVKQMDSLVESQALPESAFAAAILRQNFVMNWLEQQKLRQHVAVSESASIKNLSEATPSSLDRRSLQPGTLHPRHSWSNLAAFASNFASHDRQTNNSNNVAVSALPQPAAFSGKLLTVSRDVSPDANLSNQAADNQPLDLSTSKSSRSRDATSLENTVSPSTCASSTLSNSTASQLYQTALSNQLLSAASLIPPYSQALPALPVYSSAGNVQQMLALASYMPNGILSSQALQGYGLQAKPVSGQDYLSKLMIAVQEQQQMAAFQQAPNFSRKRNSPVSFFSESALLFALSFPTPQ